LRAVDDIVLSVAFSNATSGVTLTLLLLDTIVNREPDTKRQAVSNFLTD
jgi:hypothetical protein